MTEQAEVVKGDNYRPKRFKISQTRETTCLCAGSTSFELETHQTKVEPREAGENIKTQNLSSATSGDLDMNA